MRTKNRLLVLVLSLITWQNSSAIEEVAVIGTRSETPLSELPSNISVLGEEAVQRLAPVHIQQALSQIPGVDYQRGNGQESLPSIRSAVLTGAGACGNVLILEEAIAVRSAGFCNVNELFDTHFEQASRIEVVRGANSAFYGSNALLGSINLNLPSYATNTASLEVGANQYRRGKIALNYGELQANHGRLYLTVSEDGGFRDDSGYQQQKVSWRHVASVGDWNLKLGATGTHLDQQTAGFITGLDSYRDNQLRRQNLDPEAFRKSKSLRVWASFNRAIGNTQQLTITPYLRYAEMDFLQHFLPGDPLEQNQQKGFGWQSSLTTKVSDDLQWSIGLDGELASGELLQTQDLPTQGSAFLMATIPTGRHYDYQVDAQQLGLFTNINWQFQPQWKLLAGLRLERINYDYDNLAGNGRTREDGTECGFGGCRYSRPADRNDHFTHASPKLELQYQASAAWRWHISLADAFRAPQATELYRLQRNQIVADLDEVRARHFDVGGNWQVANSQLSFSYYRIKQRNVIIRDSDFFNIDGQQIDSQGLEVEIKHVFNDQWTMNLATSYAKHKYASDQLLGEINIRGNLLDTAPKLVASASLRWQVNHRLSSEIQIQSVSDYYLEPSNTYQYQGHNLVNWRSRFQLNDAWDASLRVLNLTDQRYAERADFTSFTDERYFPGEPRSVFAEIRFQF